MLSTNKNVLYKTRCYLPGGMQYAVNGRGWREEVKDKLKERGITFFDPYYKPFIHDIPENEESRSEMLGWMETEQYDLVSQRMRAVRGYDLRLVDLSDWFLCVISPQKASWGTAEELSTLVRQKKPLFLVIDDERGKKATPLWVMAMVQHKHIYNNLQEAIDTIIAIDDGVIKLNSDKWRLLKEELR